MSSGKSRELATRLLNQHQSQILVWWLVLFQPCLCWIYRYQRFPGLNLCSVWVEIGCCLALKPQPIAIAGTRLDISLDNLEMGLLCKLPVIFKLLSLPWGFCKSLTPINDDRHFYPLTDLLYPKWTWLAARYENPYSTYNKLPTVRV